MVSILVLVDVALELPKDIMDTYGVEGFQSLFSWMLLLNLMSPIQSPGRICFNPCSRGCCS